MDTNLQEQLHSYSTKSKKTKYIFFIFIALIISFGVYYFFFQNKTKNDGVATYNTKKVTRGDYLW